MVKQIFEYLPIGYFMKIVNWITVLIFFAHLSHAQFVYELSHCFSKPNQAQLTENFFHLGDHIVAEFLECSNIDDYDQLENVLRIAAQAANATVIDVLTYQFTPVGMSGIALLAESHISIHTWPEYGYVAVDTYTCGNKANVDTIIDVLEAFFKPKKIRRITIERGYDQIQN